MLLAGAGGSYGALSASVGYRVEGVSPFANQTWVGMSASSWPTSHPQHMCLSVQSATARLLQLREVLFLWGILDP